MKIRIRSLRNDSDAYAVEAEGFPPLVYRDGSLHPGGELSDICEAEIHDPLLEGTIASHLWTWRNAINLMASRGGSARTEKKKASSRQNGKLGGRPKKRRE